MPLRILLGAGAVIGATGVLTTAAVAAANLPWHHIAVSVRAFFG
jgi:hypothetical protein